VIHVFHTNDMFRMGGLFRAVPWIGLPFLIATLALAGVWPLPGYFSKEAILGGVLEARLAVPFLMLALTAFLTSFYMFRAVFLVFFGPRGHVHDHGQTHAVPWQMDGVCRSLAALTVALGLWMAVRGHHGGGPAWLPALSLALAAGGFLLAYLGYQRHAVDPARIAAVLRPLDVLARHRYFIDAFYAALYRYALLGFARVIGWIDRYLVDGLLNVVSAWTLRSGDILRRIQTGQPQDYVYGVALGLLALVVWAQWWGK
jgi:NADH-quinone oxidoreductase subunit L